MGNAYTRLALKTALIYAGAAALWIAFSDWLLLALVSDAELIALWSMAKGWVFVGVTAILLYATLRRGMLHLQKETEARISSQAAQRRWADAFEHCAHGIAIGDASKRMVVACNPAFARMHGYAAEELADFDAFKLLIPADHARFREHVESANRSGRAQCEATAIRKDGSVFSVGVNIVSVCNPAGVQLYHVISAEDITERKRAEAALRESETRFRTVVESIREVFWMVESGRKRMLYISPGYEEIWGLSCESLYQDPNSWLEAVFHEDHARVKDALATKSENGTYDEEFRIVRPDRSIRWIRDRAFPVRDASGQIERIVGVAEDITERKQLEAQFLRAQRLEAIGTLAGGVAHDLNNILAPMLMAAGLLKENATSARDREMLTMVERSARRGAEIIRQLLTFSRGVEGARVPLQARHLLKEIGEIVRETFPREIELIETAPRDLWSVVADATQLHQVLMNLCVNARDAMPTGGKLSMSAENRDVTPADTRARPDVKAGRYVILTVADSGTGISPENLDRIFEPFYTTKEVGKGTGLGLATVIGIVRGHGGFIRVRSELGCGSRFEVFLPAIASELDEELLATDEPCPNGSGELILVVDDEESIRDATRHVLEGHGYRVLSAANGRLAIDLYLQHRQSIRLVITDVMMPEMGGAALVGALRLLSPRLKVIATSGLEPDEKREELSTLGISEMLTKPCATRSLVGAVHRHLATPGVN